MMYTTERKPDSASVLSTLAGIIREHRAPVDRMLGNAGSLQVFNPFQQEMHTGLRRISKPVSDTFWSRMGIRRLILDQTFSPVSHEAWNAENGDGRPGSGGWESMKNDTLTKDLEGIFSCCPIIEFADWAGVSDASGFWDGLFSDVIGPLERRDFHFIFHLGDVAGKGVFEIDEALDIIGDYSSSGKVTLILDGYEADNLWSILNGAGTPPADEKYLSLFRTLNIGTLLVLQDGCGMLFSRDGEFALAGRSPVGLRGAIDARRRFAAGYQIGSLLQLEPLYCMALGLAVSGGCGAPSAGPGSAMLLSYLNEWIDDLKTSL